MSPAAGPRSRSSLYDRVAVPARVDGGPAVGRAPEPLEVETIQAFLCAADAERGRLTERIEAAGQRSQDAHGEIETIQCGLCGALTEAHDAEPGLAGPSGLTIMPIPTEALEQDEQFQAFWNAHEEPPAHRTGQLQGLVAALLPMLSLIIVLVVVLAWIG